MQTLNRRKGLPEAGFMGFCIQAEEVRQESEQLCTRPGGTFFPKRCRCFAPLQPIRRFRTGCRQTLPYRIMEGLPVTRQVPRRLDEQAQSPI